MPTPPHTLVRPHVDALAGLSEPVGSADATEIERRVEELINEWLKFYFSGTPFSTPAATGQPDATKTFTLCEIHVGKSSPSNPAPKPIIHTAIVDRREDEGRQIHGGMKVVSGDWNMSTFIKVAPQAPVESSVSYAGKASASITAAQAARRISSQFAWLIQSAHAQDIAVKGVCNPRILSGPRPVQTGAWEVYQITWAAKVHYTIASP